MVAYLVVDFEISDEAGYRGLAQVVRPLLAQHGGAIRAITRAPEVLLGAPPSPGVALLEFPSRARLQAFWTAPEFVAALRVHAAAATFVVRAVDGQ